MGLSSECARPRRSYVTRTKIIASPQPCFWNSRQWPYSAVDPETESLATSLRLPRVHLSSECARPRAQPRRSHEDHRVSPALLLKQPRMASLRRRPENAIACNLAPTFICIPSTSTGQSYAICTGNFAVRHACCIWPARFERFLSISPAYTLNPPTAWPLLKLNRTDGKPSPGCCQ